MQRQMNSFVFLKQCINWGISQKRRWISRFTGLLIFFLSNRTHTSIEIHFIKIFTFICDCCGKDAKQKLFYFPIQLVSIYAMRCSPELVWWWTIYDSQYIFLQTTNAIVMVKSNEMLLTAAMQRSMSASAINSSLCNDWTCNEDAFGYTAAGVLQFLSRHTRLEVHSKRVCMWCKCT